MVTDFSGATLDVLGDDGIFTRQAVDLAGQLGFGQIRVWGDVLPAMNASVHTGSRDGFREDDCTHLFVALFDVPERLATVKTLRHCNLVSLVHPRAVVNPTARVGRNVYIDPLAYVGMEAVVGDAVGLSSRTSVEHDNVIGEGVFLGAGATLCGHVHVGAGSFVGAGSVVTPRVQVCGGVTIGAGAVVVRDIERPGIYVGSPARLMQK